MATLTRGERFKDARTVHNQHGSQTMDEVAKQIPGIYKNTIADLENDEKERNVGYLKVAELAKHYGVSMDYLLGLTDVRTTAIEIKKFVECTGLSEDAINYLIWAKSMGERFTSENHIFIEAIADYFNDIILLPNFAEAVCDYMGFRQAHTVPCKSSVNLDVPEIATEHYQNQQSLFEHNTSNGECSLPAKDAFKFYINNIVDNIKNAFIAKYEPTAAWRDKHGND